MSRQYFDIRGLANSVNRSRHNQSHQPVVEQIEAVGHAVNCVTLLVSLVDVGVLTGLPEYRSAAERMWTDIVTRKMYVTGGVGTTGNEGFGDSRYIDVMERGMDNNALSGVSATGDHFSYVNRRLASGGDARDTRWQRASLEGCPPNLVRSIRTRTIARSRFA